MPAWRYDAALLSRNGASHLIGTFLPGASTYRLRLELCWEDGLRPYLGIILETQRSTETSLPQPKCDKNLSDVGKATLESWVARNQAERTIRIYLRSFLPAYANIDPQSEQSQSGNFFTVERANLDELPAQLKGIKLLRLRPECVSLLRFTIQTQHETSFNGVHTELDYNRLHDDAQVAGRRLAEAFPIAMEQPVEFVFLVDYPCYLGSSLADELAQLQKDFRRELSEGTIYRKFLPESHRLDWKDGKRAPLPDLTCGSTIAMDQRPNFTAKPHHESESMDRVAVEQIYGIVHQREYEESNLDVLRTPLRTRLLALPNSKDVNYLLIIDIPDDDDFRFRKNMMISVHMDPDDRAPRWSGRVLGLAPYLPQGMVQCHLTRPRALNEPMPDDELCSALDEPETHPFVNLKVEAPVMIVGSIDATRDFILEIDPVLRHVKVEQSFPAFDRVQDGFARFCTGKAPVATTKDSVAEESAFLHEMHAYFLNRSAIIDSPIDLFKGISEIPQYSDSHPDVAAGMESVRHTSKRVTLIDGLAGTGKTYFAAEIAATRLSDPELRIGCFPTTNAAADVVADSMATTMARRHVEGTVIRLHPPDVERDLLEAFAQANRRSIETRSKTFSMGRMVGKVHASLLKVADSKRQATKPIASSAKPSNTLHFRTGRSSEPRNMRERDASKIWNALDVEREINTPRRSDGEALYAQVSHMNLTLFYHMAVRSGLQPGSTDEQVLKRWSNWVALFRKYILQGAMTPAERKAVKTGAEKLRMETIGTARVLVTTTVNAMTELCTQNFGTEVLFIDEASRMTPAEWGALLFHYQPRHTVFSGDV